MSVLCVVLDVSFLYLPLSLFHSICNSGGCSFLFHKGRNFLRLVFNLYLPIHSAELRAKSVQHIPIYIYLDKVFLLFRWVVHICIVCMNMMVFI